MSSAEDAYDSSSSDDGRVCEARYYAVDSPKFIPWWQDYLEQNAENFGQFKKIDNNQYYHNLWHMIQLNTI